MGSQQGTLATLARLLVLAMSPLRAGVADEAAFRTLLARLAWDVTSLPPEFTALTAKVDAAVSALESLANDPQFNEVLGVVDKVKAVYVALQNITTAPTGVEPSIFLEEISLALIDLLLIDYLGDQFPHQYALLRGLGIITEEFTAATPERPGAIRRKLRWDEIPKIVSDPESLPARLYGWGTDHFDAAPIAHYLLRFFVALGWPAYVGSVDDSLGTGFLDASTIAGRSNWILKILVALAQIAGNEVEIGLALLQLPPEGGKHAGLILQPLIPPEVGTSYDITDTLKLKLRAGSDIAQTFGLLVRPDGISVKFPFQQGAALPQAGFGVTLSHAPPSPTLLLGDPITSRLSMQGLSASMDVETLQDTVELKGTLAPNGLSVVIAANDQDGFLHTLIGGQDAAIPIPLAI